MYSTMLFWCQSIQFWKSLSRSTRCRRRTQNTDLRRRVNQCRCCFILLQRLPEFGGSCAKHLIHIPSSSPSSCSSSPLPSPPQTHPRLHYIVQLRSQTNIWQSIFFYSGVCEKNARPQWSVIIIIWKRRCFIMSPHVVYFWRWSSHDIITLCAIRKHRT